jgi:hypothetical protein
VRLLHTGPVGLAWDIPPHAAAKELLERVGYRPTSLKDAWAAAVAGDNPAPDPLLLAEALKTYCSRVVPDWDVIQFDPRPAAMLGRCLGLLDLVHTEDEAREWLTGCKTVMRHILRRSDDFPAG